MTYEERQKLNVWWIWGLLSLAAFLTLFAVISSFVGAGGAGWEEVLGASFAAVSLVTVMAVIAAMTMYTRIDEYGVEVSIKPFVTKKFFWREVESVTLEDHDNTQFGYKKNPFTKTESIAVNKGQVVVLRLRNGRQFRIGTQRPAAVDAFLRELFDTETAYVEPIESDLLAELQRIQLQQRR